MTIEYEGNLEYKRGEWTEEFQQEGIYTEIEDWTTKAGGDIESKFLKED